VTHATVHRRVNCAGRHWAHVRAATVSRHSTFLLLSRLIAVQAKHDIASHVEPKVAETGVEPLAPQPPAADVTEVLAPEPADGEVVGIEDASQWKMLVALCALVAVICSVDRAAISVTILPMSAAFLWDDSTKGIISSAFFLGCER
jgi:hypothetical protein